MADLETTCASCNASIVVEETFAEKTAEAATEAGTEPIFYCATCIVASRQA
jgi:hypothetical protein